ncbi:MAG: sensor histidine kinase, partial [Saprospiraceae bacterium]|nr:sensor histidine kinase [Saprospiraceae bacterium]
SETQDSIHLREARQIAVQTEAVYQTKLAQEQIERGERERTFAYGIAGLLALFGIGLFVGFVQKQKSNRKLKDLIEQREFLVKEIHHRVKNNLQIISSLLNLQADEIEDVSAALAVAEGRNRVQSMSLIHQQLYLGEHMMDIDMRIYLDDLTEHLVDSLGFPGQGIETEIDVQVPPLDVDTAIPIGLIVNELVTNSMKYAFAKDENGKIFIELFLENPNNLILRLKDNGRSSVDSQVHSQGTKFGSGLVDILSKKLKGKVDRNHRESGYETEIRFRRFRLGSSVAEA